MYDTYQAQRAQPTKGTRASVVVRLIRLGGECLGTGKYQQHGPHIEQMALILLLVANSY